MEHNHVFLRFPEGRTKALSFTFDDGTVEDVWMAERFGELGLCGTINLNSGLFPAPGTDFSKLNIDIFPVKDIQHRMTAEEAVAALDRPYIEIASHGSLHSDPTLLDKQSLIWEMMSDRQALEALFHRPVTGYAYPQSAFNKDVIETAKLCGYEYARTVCCTNGFNLPGDLWTLAPTCAFSSPNVEELCDKFLSFVPTTGMYWYTTKPAFFNIFGHTYEMNVNEGLKERFDALMEKLAGHDDVWYVTNIQLVRYLKAFNGLIYSADRSSVYNPSAERLWLYHSGGCCSIAPGETVVL